MASYFVTEPKTATALMSFSFESLLAPHLGPRDILRLFGQVWSYNLRSCITGTTSIEQNRIRQHIEGPCDEILALSARILTDPRHVSITVVGLRLIVTRRFSQWSMAFCDVRAPDAPKWVDPQVADLAQIRRLRVAAHHPRISMGAGPLS